MTDAIMQTADRVMAATYKRFPIVLKRGPQLEVLAVNSLDETFYALEGDDMILAEGGADTVWAGDGNDTVLAGAGNDMVDGGAGDDVFDFNGGDATTVSGEDGDDAFNLVDTTVVVAATIDGGEGAENWTAAEPECHT